MNTVTKYMVSRTMTKVDWDNLTFSKASLPTRCASSFDNGVITSSIGLPPERSRMFEQLDFVSQPRRDVARDILIMLGIRFRSHHLGRRHPTATTGVWPRKIRVARVASIRLLIERGWLRVAILAQRTEATVQNLTELHEALARVVLADRELSEVLTQITGISRRAMPSIEAASITLIRGDKPFTAAYDGQMALDADELQYERGYGPCMDAGRAAQILLIDDMRSEQRWPDYAQHAAAHGVLSSLSVPLPFQGATIGALNAYAGRPQVIDDHDVELAEEVAA